MSVDRTDRIPSGKEGLSMLLALAEAAQPIWQRFVDGMPETEIADLAEPANWAAAFCLAMAHRLGELTGVSLEVEVTADTIDDAMIEDRADQPEGKKLATLWKSVASG